MQSKKPKNSSNYQDYEADFWEHYPKKKVYPDLVQPLPSTETAHNTSIQSFNKDIDAKQSNKRIRNDYPEYRNKRTKTNRFEAPEAIAPSELHCQNPNNTHFVNPNILPDQNYQFCNKDEAPPLRNPINRFMEKFPLRIYPLSSNIVHKQVKMNPNLDTLEGGLQSCYEFDTGFPVPPRAEIFQNGNNFFAQYTDGSLTQIYKSSRIRQNTRAMPNRHILPQTIPTAPQISKAPNLQPVLQAQNNIYPPYIVRNNEISKQKPSDEFFSMRSRTYSRSFFTESYAINHCTTQPTSHIQYTTKLQNDMARETLPVGFFS